MEEVKVVSEKGKVIMKVKKEKRNVILTACKPREIPIIVPMEKKELLAFKEPQNQKPKTKPYPNLGEAMAEKLEKGKAPKAGEFKPSKVLQKVVLEYFDHLEDPYPEIEPERKPIVIYRQELIKEKTLYPKK